MVAHIHPVRHLKRQVNPLDQPNAPGLDGAVTVGTNAVGATLAADTAGQGPGITGTAPPLAFTNVPVITETAETPPETTETAAAQASQSSGPNKNVLPLSTVVGACLGALAGATLLILVGLWFYKRSAPKGRARHPNSPLSANRNAQGDMARNRSRMEHWNKLGEIDDKWESKYQTKEVSSPAEGVGPMEKLTMFKSPSIRTAYTHRSEEQQPTFNLEPHPFSAYHPGLAQDMAKDKPDEPQPTPRPFLGRVDVGPAISWDSQGSFLSVNSRLSGNMSPTPGFAIPTPHITSSEPHRWESAEVLVYDESENSHSNNPFLETTERKPSNNPFFGAPISKQASIVPDIVTPPTPKVDKGKARDLTGSTAAEAQPAGTSNDPFGDDNAKPSDALRPSILSTSASSVSSNERALQSLIAALDLNDLSPEDVNERLRVASMQPSVISYASAYTSGGEEDVTQSFPLPPGNYSQP